MRVVSHPDNWERRELITNPDARMSKAGDILETLRENALALQSAAKLIEERIAPLPCDSVGSVSCVRCATVYLARIGGRLGSAFRLLDAIDRAGGTD